MVSMQQKRARCRVEEDRDQEALAVGHDFPYRVRGSDGQQKLLLGGCVLENGECHCCRNVASSPLSDLYVPPPNLHWVNGNVASRFALAESVDFGVEPAPELVPLLSRHDLANEDTRQVYGVLMATRRPSGRTMHLISG